MVSPVQTAHFCTDLRTFAQDIPPAAILLDFLRPLETALLDKDFLNESPGHLFYPLWFVAEIERNVFLWRNGFSLSDHVNFEFWVDMERLISKRNTLIGGECLDNPLVHPGELLSDQPLLDDAGEREQLYLQEFEKIFAKISKHAQVLSTVTSQIQQELGSAPQEEITRIVLPYSRSKYSQGKPQIKSAPAS